MEKKKIIFVTHSAANGGAERVSCILANKFVESGHDVTFFAIHSDSRQYYLDPRINYHFCEIKSTNKVAKQIERAINLKKYVNENKFDVMVSFVCVEGLFLLGNKKIKKVYSLRNDPNRVLNNGMWKHLRNMIYGNADAIVFQTEDARDYFADEIRNKGTIIPNPIRTDLPEWNAECHNTDIVAAGRISEQKNFKMLIDAFNIFSKENTENNLVIYGKGELLDSLKSYAVELGLGERVRFPGYSDDIQTVMTQAAMYVSSSDYEGISNSMLEALAIGIPSVCTDCPIGGAKMFIESGKNGFLTEVGNANDMAEKMLKLMNDKNLQKNFSNESKKIRDKISEDVVLDMWQKVIV